MSPRPTSWTSGPDGAWDSLLAACSRPRATPEQGEWLRALAPEYARWDSLVHRAANFGLAPLVAHHLRAAQAPVPRGVDLQLQAIRMQERRRLKARRDALVEILDLLDDLDLLCRVLKGMVVGPLVYPDPDLRATTDIDLLLRPDDAQQAWQLLQDRLGFTVTNPRDPGHRHLGELGLNRDGAFVMVEVHDRLGPGLGGPTFDEVPGEPLPVDVGGGVALSLPLVELVRHVHAHGFGEPLWLWRFMFHARAIADLVGFVEELDDAGWGEVVDALPWIVDSARMLAWITPLSERGLARVAPLGEEPDGVGQWARPPFEDFSSSRVLRHFERRRAAKDVSEWWLRLRHGGIGSLKELRRRHNRELEEARR